MYGVLICLFNLQTVLFWVLDIQAWNVSDGKQFKGKRRETKHPSFKRKYKKHIICYII